MRYGAACSAQADANHQAIDGFLSGIAAVGLDPATARQFGDVKHQKGAAIRSNVQVLAATIV